MMEKPDPLREQNHDLLLKLAEQQQSIVGQVNNVASALRDSIVAQKEDSTRLWHQLEKQGSNISSVSDRVANIGKPQITSIVSVCAFLGTIAVAFIAPIKSDIARSEKLGEQVVANQLKFSSQISELQTSDSEFREKQSAIRDKLDYVAANGSTAAQVRLGTVENDILWMRGEKSLRGRRPGD